jgi:hypothetical protein
MTLVTLMTVKYSIFLNFQFKTLSENLSVKLEQRLISPRMGLPMFANVTVLEGDASYEQGYPNDQEEGGLLPSSETPVEETQDLNSRSACPKRARKQDGEEADPGSPTEPSSTASGTCFGPAASGKRSIGIGSGLVQASSMSVSRDGLGWASSRS